MKKPNPFKKEKKEEGGAKRTISKTFDKKQRGVFKPVIDRSVPEDDEDMRLNKFVALCGIASRRAAADLIKEGHVTVNGDVNTEIGYRVLPKDVVAYKGRTLALEAKKIYILMNKPKDTITTASDDKGRKTVMDIIRRTIKERIYPIGRLDRDTTGLLVLTNDGDMAQKLSHPSYKVKKLYHVVLNKALTAADFKQITEGLKLEDGVAEVDAINYAEGAGKDEVMIEIHIGKNRIVRRIFEHLGYDVVKLDRVYYGGLTKKDLPRSGYRTLTEREVIMLKHFTGK
jgi:23S rRNA pseudouridine2605 synthase